MKAIYSVSVRVRPIERTDWPVHCPEAWATIYVPAEDADEATNVADRCLESDHYRLIRIGEVRKIEQHLFSEFFDLDGDPLEDFFETILARGGHLYDKIVFYEKREL